MLDIRVPAEQEGTRSSVLRWLKQIGDAVQQHEPLVELETDKVTVEVPAPAAGVLREIAKPEGTELEPGEVLGRLEVGAQAQPAAPAGAVSASVAAPKAHAAAQPATLAQGDATRPLSPAVRRLLAERGLEVSSVATSGSSGRLSVDDVLNFQAGAGGLPASVVKAPVATEAQPGVRRVAHSATRLRIAEHMVESLHTAPHVTSVFEADLTAVIADRERRRPEFERHGVPLTFTAYFVRAAVAGIRAVPEANARWGERELEVFEHIDMGIATALEGGGLVVPVLRGVESLDLMAIATGLHDLVSRARGAALKPADMRGGTFTISNHGVSGSLLATPIVINQPQSAILGVGKLEKRAVVLEDGGIVAQPRCYVTLTIDHRVMDGLEANRFLSAFIAALR